MKRKGTVLLYTSGLLLSLLSISNARHDKTYTFAFSNDGFPNDFVEKGQLVGQSIDILMEVCAYAKKKCVPTLVQRMQCWDTTKGFPPFSEVLNGRYFDSCANYPESPERRMSYGFPAQNYFRSPEPSLVVSDKTKTTLNDLKSCNNLTLAYPSNTALEPDCLYDAGLFVREDNVEGVFTKEFFDLRSIMNEITRKVVLREVDMGIVLSRFTRTDEVRVLLTLPCINQIKSGLTHMFRIDDTNLIDWWDDAVWEYMCSPRYKEFCEEVFEKYAIDPLCRVEGVDLDCSKFGGDKAKEDKKAVERRITPCISEECRKRAVLDFSTWRNGYYSLNDPEERNPHKALVGSGESYAGKEKKGVAFYIEGRDAGLFRPDRVCMKVKNVKNIKFIFRGGEREAEQLSVLVDFRKEWTTHCESSTEFRRSVRVELTIVNKFNFDKGTDKRIRITDMIVDACTQRAFITS